MFELHAGEEIKLMVRKHWLVFVGQVFFVLLVFIAPFVIFSLLGLVSGYASPEVQGSVESAMNDLPIAFFSILWTFIVWIWGFILWTDYYLDIWVVTNERIVDINQHGFFKREISTFRMDRVQNITTEVRGIIPTFLNYGDITVQTAGDNKTFVMRGAPAPSTVKQVVSALIESRRAENNSTSGGL